MSKTTPRLRVLLDEQQTTFTSASSNHNHGVTGRKAFLTKNSPHRVAPLDNKKRQSSDSHLPQISPIKVSGSVHPGLQPAHSHQTKTSGGLLDTSGGGGLGGEVNGHHIPPLQVVGSKPVAKAGGAGSGRSDKSSGKRRSNPSTGGRGSGGRPPLAGAVVEPTTFTFVKPHGPPESGRKTTSSGNGGAAPPLATPPLLDGADEPQVQQSSGRGGHRSSSDNNNNNNNNPATMLSRNQKQQNNDRDRGGEIGGPAPPAPLPTASHEATHQVVNNNQNSYHGSSSSPSSRPSSGRKHLDTHTDMVALPPISVKGATPHLPPPRRSTSAFDDRTPGQETEEEKGAPIANQGEQERQQEQQRVTSEEWTPNGNNSIDTTPSNSINSNLVSPLSLDQASLNNSSNIQQQQQQKALILGSNGALTKSPSNNNNNISSALSPYNNGGGSENFVGSRQSFMSDGGASSSNVTPLVTPNNGRKKVTLPELARKSTSPAASSTADAGGKFTPPPELEGSGSGWSDGGPPNQSFSSAGSMSYMRELGRGNSSNSNRSSFNQGLLTDGPPLRPDINGFLERVVKESKKRSEMNLPHLLAHILPAIGIHDLKDIDTQSSGGGSFYLPGSDEGSNVFLSRTPMAPFVSHMTFLSVNDPDTGEASDFQPVALQGALMFLDMSGYSRISAALADKGAHAISDAVNSYMEKLLDIIVKDFHGDVLKFAGDAVMVAWTYEADLERSCLAAAMCALKLQEMCPEYPVESDAEEGEELSFKIHIGLAAGQLESDVFQPKTNTSMQKAYHYVHGEIFSSIGPIVDTAKSGEVCCCPKLKEIVEDHIEIIHHPDDPLADEETGKQMIFQCIKQKNSCSEEYEFLMSDGPVLPERPRGMESQFVHPAIVKKLHFGVKMEHMAEMRLLCVLFIHKSNERASTSDWFYESQAILDANRCPVVQIIDDDKGIHLVAAVNLFVAEPDPTLAGLKAARALREREVECKIGMATGVTFCGIVGSEHACRWDITGPACVRAARLMQYAVANDIDIVVDESLREQCSDVSQLTEVRSGVVLKGSPVGVSIFTLSEKSNEVTSRIVANPTVSEDVHAEAYEQLLEVREKANGECRRAVGLISGPVGSGKKTLCVRLTAGYVRIMHQTVRKSPPLTLAHSIATWFSYHSDKDVAELSRQIDQSFNQSLISRTMHQCLDLVAMTIEKGLSTCLIVHHSHFLDSYSLSLLHQIHNAESQGPGKWITLLTHIPMFEAMSISQLKSAVSQGSSSSGGDSKAPAPVAYLTKVGFEGLYKMLDQTFAWKMSQESLKFIYEHGGGVLEFGQNATIALRSEYARRRRVFEETGVQLSELSRVDKSGTAVFFPEGRDVVRLTPWTVSAPQLVSRLTGLYDVLPPRLQTILKVIASMSMQSTSYHPLVSDVGWMTLKLVSKRNAKEVTHDVRILADLQILETDSNYRRVWFLIPAMRDMVIALATPDQQKAINTECFKKYEENLVRNGKENDPWYLMTLARFAVQAYGPKSSSYQHHMQRCWNLILDNKQNGKNPKQFDWLEHEFLMDSIKFKYKPLELFNGADPQRKDPIPTDGKLSDKIPDVVVDVKNYMAPVSLGPLCDLLVAIARLVKDGYIATMTRTTQKSGTEESLLSVQDAVPRYMTMLRRWEKVVPPADVKEPRFDKETEDREAELVSKFILPCRTEKAALGNCVAFLEYTKTTVARRASRATSYASWMRVLPSRAEKNRPILARAFHALEADTLGHITTESFHGALMALATQNWAPTNPQITLEWIRDSCLRKRTTSLSEFKSFLYLYCVLTVEVEDGQ